MITWDKLALLERSTSWEAKRDDSCGFSYGASFITVSMVNTDDWVARPEPHWWAACLHCHKPALLRWHELSNGKRCETCIIADWRFTSDEEVVADRKANRRLMALGFLQEAATSAFMVGGRQAVEVLVRGYRGVACGG